MVLPKHDCKFFYILPIKSVSPLLESGKCCVCADLLSSAELTVWSEKAMWFLP